MKAAMLINLVNIPFLLLVIIVISPLTNAATIWAVANEYLGHPISAAQALKAAARSLSSLIGTSLLAGLWIFLGFLALIIPGIYLSLKYALITHAVMLEKTTGSEALARS